MNLTTQKEVISHSKAFGFKTVFADALRVKVTNGCKHNPVSYLFTKNGETFKMKRV